MNCFWERGILHSWLHLRRYCTTFRAEQINMSLPLLLSLIKGKCCMKSGCAALQGLILFRLTSNKIMTNRIPAWHWCTYIHTMWGRTTKNQLYIWRRSYKNVFFFPRWREENTSHSVTGRQRKGPTPRLRKRWRPELFWDLEPCYLA